MKITTLMLLLSVLVSSACLSACSLIPQKAPADDDSADSQSFDTVDSDQPSSTDSADQTDDTMVAINTVHGQIVIKLFPDQCPRTVENFLNKINSGFYNNLTFHRVEPGFVVQGGDPKGNGTGGGIIKSEINQIPFKRASVGLARGGIKEQSNDSQFFICLADSTCQSLTNEYVNFGQVVLGMDAVDQIRVGDKINSAVTQTK